MGDDEFNQILSEDFELALPMLQAVIAELARYAIQDIHLERTLMKKAKVRFTLADSATGWSKGKGSPHSDWRSESHIRRATLCTLK